MFQGKVKVIAVLALIGMCLCGSASAQSTGWKKIELNRFWTFRVKATVNSKQSATIECAMDFMGRQVTHNRMDAYKNGEKIELDKRKRGLSGLDAKGFLSLQESNGILQWILVIEVKNSRLGGSARFKRAGTISLREVPSNTSKQSKYVRVGKKYEGYFTKGYNVTYHVKRKERGRDVFTGHIEFHWNGSKEDMKITYFNDGSMELIRFIPAAQGGGTQRFVSQPNYRSNGTTFSGRLRGRGVGTAPNEWGKIFIPK